MLLSRNVTSPIFFKIASFLTFIADCNELYQKPVFCNSRDKCSLPFASEKLPLLLTRFFITFKSISSRDVPVRPGPENFQNCPAPPHPENAPSLTVSLLCPEDFTPYPVLPHPEKFFFRPSPKQKKGCLVHPCNQANALFAVLSVLLAVAN